MATQDPKIAGLIPSTDLQSATILTTLDVAELAYDAYGAGNVLTTTVNNVMAEATAEIELVKDGWAQIPALAGQNISADNYQGVAFYKVINGITEVIIGNRGSAALQDFAVSDAQLALGITPQSDKDAVAYYKSVLDWLSNANNGITAPINIIETGHSLGGQEADYVEVQAQNGAIRGSDPTEAVTFDAPGLGNDVQLSQNYNALNISAQYDFVHVGGSLLNQGYAGQNDTISAGTPVKPNAALDLIGFVLGGADGVLLSKLGQFLYNGLYTNHVTGVLDGYFNSHAALSGVDLQTFAPGSITQADITALEQVPQDTFANMTPAQRTTYYQELLGSGMLASSNAGTSSSETFTVTSDTSGSQFTGSNGDTLDVSNSGSQITVTDGKGDTTTLNFSSNGQALVSDTWTEANGIHGSETYNPDGSSSGTTTYASGGYASYIDDGEGNLSTDYYSSNGHNYAASWEHADGTSGAQTFIGNGLTTVGGSSFNVEQSVFETIENPDGSYETVTFNPQNQVTDTQSDSSGRAISSSTNPGEGSNFDLSSTTSVTDPYGTDGTITFVHDAAGDLVSDQWSQGDGTAGSDTFNASGVATGTSNNLDGSSDTYWRHGGDITRDHFNLDGSITKDQWQLSDGTSGSDTFNSDGSGSGTITRSDGSTSTVSVDASLDVTIDNFSAQGVKTSEDVWHQDGTYDITIYNPDGSATDYTYLGNGQVNQTDYGQDGSVATAQSEPAGSLMSPDGAQLGKIQTSDGGYSINYTDSAGDSLVFNIGTGGQIEGTEHTSASQSPVSEYTGTFNGQTWVGPYNQDTPIVTDSNGTQFTIYESNSGKITGEDWANSAAGTHGFDSFNSDGSSVQTAYNADGSYSSTQSDGLGNSSTNFFAADSTLVSDTWQNANGAFGDDTFNADGSSAGRSYSADGSYIGYTDDGQGNVLEAQYSALGGLTQDYFTKSDGSYGADTFNADGSKNGSVYQADGSYLTYSDSAAGNDLTDYYTAAGVLTVQVNRDSSGDVTTAYYDVSGVKLTDTWTKTDGSYGNDTFNSDGSSSGITHFSDGRYDTDVNDGQGLVNTQEFDSNGILIGTSRRVTDAQGNVLTTNYDIAGTLRSDSWSHVDGTYGSDIFNSDGSSSG